MNEATTNLTRAATQRKPFKSGGLPVLRVKNLSGGNYWGKKTEEGVALSVNEFFGKNFSSSFVGGVRNHISNQIGSDSRYYERFESLNFTE